MSKARWTADDFKKVGLIETPNGFVPGKNLVAKGKVEKIEPNDNQKKWSDLPSYAEAVINAEKERAANPDKPFVYFESETFKIPPFERVVIKHTFDLSPFPAPRMTRSDQWKTDPNHPDPAKRQRRPVVRYFAWRDAFICLCNQKGYTLQERLHIIFIMPMPKYFSRKKRETMNGQPHKQRPDTDNMMKSVKDAFAADDGFVWDERGVKVWGEKGQILIF